MRPPADRCMARPRYVGRPGFLLRKCPGLLRKHCRRQPYSRRQCGRRPARAKRRGPCAWLRKRLHLLKEGRALLAAPALAFGRAGVGLRGVVRPALGALFRRALARPNLCVAMWGPRGFVRPAVGLGHCGPGRFLIGAKRRWLRSRPSARLVGAASPAAAGRPSSARRLAGGLCLRLLARPSWLRRPSGSGPCGPCAAPSGPCRRAAARPAPFPVLCGCGPLPTRAWLRALRGVRGCGSAGWGTGTEGVNGANRQVCG